MNNGVDEDEEELLVSNNLDDTSPNSSPHENNAVSSKVQTCLKSITVEVTVFLYFLAFGLHYTLITKLFQEKTCIMEFNLTSSECKNQSSSNESEIQVRVSSLLMKQSLLENIPSVFTCMFYGHIGDIYGRKIPLIAPLCGKLASCLIYMLNAYLMHIPAEFMLLASIPSGLTGGFPTLLMASYAYLSDITTHDDRTKRIGYLDVAIFFGPMCGGLLSLPVFSLLGYLGIFAISSAILFLAILYSVIRISEDRDAQHDNRQFKALNIFPLFIRGIFESFKSAFKKRSKYDRAIILTSAGGLSLFLFSIGSLSLEFLYVEKKFSWSYEQYTIFNTCVGLSITFGMMALLPLFIFLKAGAITLLVIGSLSGALYYIFLGISSGTWLIYIAAVVSFFRFVPPVILRSTTSQVVPSEELGKVFSFISASESIMPLTSVPTLTYIYNSTIESFPGTVFLVCSASLCLMLLYTLPVQILHKKSSSEAITEDLEQQ